MTRIHLLANGDVVVVQVPTHLALVESLSKASRSCPAAHHASGVSRLARVVESHDVTELMDGNRPEVELRRPRRADGDVPYLFQLILISVAVKWSPE